MRVFFATRARPPRREDSVTSHALAFLERGGAMGAVVRAFDWASTSLGPLEAWPQSLRAAVGMLINNSEPKLLIWGPERLVIHNDNYLPFVDAPRANGIGAPFSEVSPGLFSDIEPLVDEAMAGRGTCIPSLRARRREGPDELGYFIFSSAPIYDEQEAVAGAKLTLLEITATVEHNLATTRERDRLLTLFEQAPGLMALCSGPRHRIEFANIAFRELISGRCVTGRPTGEAFPELEREGLIGLLDEVYRTGIPHVEYGRGMMLQRDPAGAPEERVLNFVYQPVRDDDVITGVLLHGQDVTDQVRAQERVQLLQNNLIHLSRINAMATMASVLAHELNQPITAAVNFLRGARRSLERGGGTALALACSGIGGAEESVMRAGDIIRRIRTMVATGEVRTERHDVAELVGGALQLASIGTRDAGVAVEANLPPGLTVMADRTQIEQVVLSIVRNAIEAMVNAPRRRLSIVAEAAGETIEIRIGDSGPGLSPEVQEHLFEPFFTSKPEGMGVGLSISRTIVEAHGGLLLAENGPDGGAMFRFTLPAAEGGPAPPPGPGSSETV